MATPPRSACRAISAGLAFRCRSASCRPSSARVELAEGAEEIATLEAQRVLRARDAGRLASRLGASPTPLQQIYAHTGRSACSGGGAILCLSHDIDLVLPDAHKWLSTGRLRRRRCLRCSGFWNGDDFGSERRANRANGCIPIRRLSEYSFRAPSPSASCGMAARAISPGRERNCASEQNPVTTEREKSNEFASS